MVNNCANPQCAKPLHYLREGRIFVFEIKSQAADGAGSQPGHHLEHFWLCGSCAKRFRVEHAIGSGMKLVPRAQNMRETASDPPVPTVLAS